MWFRQEMGICLGQRVESLWSVRINPVHHMSHRGVRLLKRVSTKFGFFVSDRNVFITTRNYPWFTTTRCWLLFLNALVRYLGILLTFVGNIGFRLEKPCRHVQRSYERLQMYKILRTFAQTSQLATRWVDAIIWAHCCAALRTNAALFSIWVQDMLNFREHSCLQIVVRLGFAFQTS